GWLRPPLPAACPSTAAPPVPVPVRSASRSCLDDSANETGNSRTGRPSNRPASRTIRPASPCGVTDSVDHVRGGWPHPPDTSRRHTRDGRLGGRRYRASHLGTAPPPGDQPPDDGREKPDTGSHDDGDHQQERGPCRPGGAGEAQLTSRVLGVLGTGAGGGPVGGRGEVAKHRGEAELAAGLPPLPPLDAPPAGGRPP